MRWIEDIKEAQTTLRQGMECALRSDDLNKSGLARLTFDCVEFHSRRFLNFLHNLMKLSGDMSFRYAVLSPDPISYFFTHFRKYPVVEMSLEDQEDAYIAALTEDPGGSPADAIGTNWSEYAILPPSGKWCIHARRDARSGEGGHLWIPANWSDEVKKIYPYSLH
jgi:hypothetical protein